VIWFLKLDYAYGGRYEFMENGGGLWVRWILLISNNAKLSVCCSEVQVR
jgi:hypothetical protein